MKVGITLPQFSADARAMVEAAKRAEDAGIDAVFAYDHYPRAGRPEALHGLTMLGALAEATESMLLGTLVARIGVVPDAHLMTSMRTASRLAGALPSGAGRFIAGVGVGDKESDIEDDALEITRPSLDERFVRVEKVAAQLMSEGIQVWVGGKSRRAATVAAATGAGRNLWAPTDQQLTEACAESEGRPVTWGATLDITTDDGLDALTQKLAALAAMGIAVAVVAPTKAGAPDAAARVMRAKAQAGLV